MEVNKGYILISDISGYTEFLVQSELQHAKEILDTLLNTGVHAMHPPVRVVNTRGDAIFAYAAETDFLQPQSLLDSVKAIYFDFRRQLELMVYNTTCPCRACANMAGLELKLFLHHGEYIEQDIDGAVELQGADVILANLLMKNHVKEATGLTGYGLITDAALAAMDAENLALDMTPHTESYEHFDEVGMRIWDLPSLYETDKAKQRAAISQALAWVTESVDVGTPPWVTWDRATDEECKRKYYDMISVERVGDTSGPVGEGSQYHCRHEMGDVTFTITDWCPPRHFTSDEIALGIPVEFTMQVAAKGSGSTIRILYGEPRVDNPAELEPLFRGAAREALDRLAALLETV